MLCFKDNMHRKKMKKTEVFNNWAVLGRDLGMEEGHSKPVDEMLSFAINERNKINQNFRCWLWKWLGCKKSFKLCVMLKSCGYRWCKSNDRECKI